MWQINIAKTRLFHVKCVHSTEVSVSLWHKKNLSIVRWTSRSIVLFWCEVPAVKVCRWVDLQSVGWWNDESGAVLHEENKRAGVRMGKAGFRDAFFHCLIVCEWQVWKVGVRGQVWEKTEALRLVETGWTWGCVTVLQRYREDGMNTKQLLLV